MIMKSVITFTYDYLVVMRLFVCAKLSLIAHYSKLAVTVTLLSIRLSYFKCFCFREYRVMTTKVEIVARVARGRQCS